MNVRAAYKRAERKTRIADIKMEFVTGPKPDGPVTVFLTAVGAGRIDIFRYIFGAFMHLPLNDGFRFRGADSPFLGLSGVWERPI
jgi:hypothetical protein